MRNPHEEEDFVKKLNSHLTPIERQRQDRLQQETSRMWRNFWINIAHQHGYSNRQIAREFGLSEGTVRAIMKKDVV